MARPIKTGLDYFSFDVDFYDNLKIRKIMRACGPAAGSILTCLLCTIYRNKGYYIQWDEDMPFEIADKVGVSEGAVSEVIKKAIQVDFFSGHQYEANQVLTSPEIQSRYKAGTIKRNEVTILPELMVFECNNQVIDTVNPVNGAGNTQSKVKESTVKKSKALVVPRDDHSSQGLKKEYDDLVKTLEGKEKTDIWTTVREFIRAKKPSFIEPYMDAWNIFAISMRLIKEPQKITEKRRKKFNTRIGEAGFDFLKILEMIKGSSFLKGENKNGWKVTIEFILDSEENYTKILEGKYE